MCGFSATAVHGIIQEEFARPGLINDRFWLGAVLQVSQNSALYLAWEGNKPLKNSPPWAPIPMLPQPLPQFVQLSIHLIPQLSSYFASESGI